jgi:hypothetical protein
MDMPLDADAANPHNFIEIGDDNVNLNDNEGSGSNKRLKINVARGDSPSKS